MIEIRAAILKAVAQKKIDRSHENYTVIRLPRNRSFKIEKNPPEKLALCGLRQSVMGQVDRNYVRHF